LLAPVLSAWSAFVLCRYVSGSISASLVGGYVLGFSTYFVGHLLGGHLVLVLAFPIPIALYLACRHFDGSITRPWFVPLFTLTIAILFLTEVELFATVMLFGMATGCVFRLLADAHEAEKLRYVAKSVVISMATTSIILSPYLYHMFAHGFPRRAMNSPKAYAADILNFAIPTPVSLLGISPLLQNIARRFSGGFGEATSYVGPVLLFIVYRFWRSDRTRLGSRVLLWLFAIICIASIGPMIHIAGVSIVPTPWTIVVALPIVKHALPARFSVLMFLDLALIVALYLAAQKPALRLVLGILVVVSLLPNPWHLRGQEVDTPVFFSNGIYRQWLAPNEIVLVLPYGLAGNSMLWQAQSDMYFRMQGGYVSTQIPDAFRGEQIVQSLEHNVCFENCAEQFLAFVDEHQVGAVVVPERYEREWAEFLSRMPSAPIRVGGVALYQLAPRH
jgi:hypothetical protein